MNVLDDNVVNFSGARTRARPDKTQPTDPVRDSLAALDDLRRLVERGEIDGFMIVAKHKPTGLPYTDIAFPQHQVPVRDAFFYMGVLDCMKNEIADIAAMAPAVLPDGTLIDPECRR